MAVNIKTKKKQVNSFDTGKTDISIPTGDSATLVKTAVAKALVQSPNGGEEQETQEVASIIGKGPFANVGVSASRTINLGDYNSLKIQVDLHVPCEVSEDEINASYEFAKAWVDDKMTALSEEYSGS